MKTNSNKAFLKIIILLFFFIGYVSYAQEEVPDPDPCPPPCATPPPDKAPIDENITILLTVTTLFGIYIIYKHNLSKKRPI